MKTIENKLYNVQEIASAQYFADECLDVMRQKVRYIHDNPYDPHTLDSIIELSKSFNKALKDRKKLIYNLINTHKTGKEYKL